MKMPSEQEMKQMSLPELQQLLSSKEDELAQKLGELEMLDKTDMKAGKRSLPHMMFDPKSGDQQQAMTEEQHNALEAKGYVHEDQLTDKMPMEQPEENLQPEIMPMDEFGMGMTPEKVQLATSMLVEAGMLDAVSGNITPELVAQLQMIADQIDPGLYDLSQPEQLEEFINGINDGTIQLRAKPPAASGPDALPAGQPAGLPAAGLAPAGGLPAGDIAAPPIL